MALPPITSDGRVAPSAAAGAGGSTSSTQQQQQQQQQQQALPDLSELAAALGWAGGEGAEADNGTAAAASYVRALWHGLHSPNTAPEVHWPALVSAGSVWVVCRCVVVLGGGCKGPKYLRY